MKKSDSPSNTIEKLLSKIDALITRVEQLESENASLKEELRKYKTPKNSKNSSIPPSKDENRIKPNQSLRKPSVKKPGGQPGRKGKTLNMTAIPDEIITLEPIYCKSCGTSLIDKESEYHQSRQKVDIPPIKAIFKEYQTFSKYCSCGCTTTADFPDYVNHSISYGSNVEGLIAYFHARQYLPFGRMKELMNEVFNIDISEGGIHYLLNKFSEKSKPCYELIKQRISKSPVIGTDETGVNIAGNKHWYWTWQTDKLTFIAHSENRGFATIERLFGAGFEHSILVHDGWRAQLKTKAFAHQTCIPHLLRRIKYLNQLYKAPKWIVKFEKLLYKALDLKRIMKPQDYISNTSRDQIQNELSELINNPPKDIKLKEVISFHKRMNKEQEQLLTFLNYYDVPADNNGSERAIRNVKVKQKISGAFRTIKNAQQFAIIRSVIDTALKNGQNILNALDTIAKFQFN